MTPTFLDTSYLLALSLADDDHHQRALAWQRRVTGELLTTEDVLVEFVDALAEPRLRGLAIEVVSALRREPSVKVVPATTRLLDEGLAMFASRRDKAWSLTDCISFVEMHRVAARDALTSDHHFEQAGFRALLRTEPPEA